MVTINYLIIQAMKEMMTSEEMDNMPSDVSSILLKYFESSCRHGQESVELMQFYMAGTKNSTAALEKVIKNSKKYTSSALLSMAIDVSKNANIKTPKMDKKAIFIPIVFSLFESACEKKTDGTSALIYVDFYGRQDSSDTAAYLQWFYNEIAKRNTAAVANGPQYAKFLDLLSSTPLQVETLVAFMKTIEDCKFIHSAAKEKIGVAIIHRYEQRFKTELTAVSHSAYHRLLQNMCSAQQICAQYVHDGASKFQTAVVDFIRKHHKSKRKLIKLLDQYFKPGVPGPM